MSNTPLRNGFATYFADELSASHKRVKLRSFGIAVDFARWPFNDDFKIQYSEVLYKAIFRVMASAGLVRANIQFTTPEESIRINEANIRRGSASRTGWFAISSDEPGRSFGVVFDDERFQIRSSNILLEDVVFLSSNVFAAIIDVFLSENLATLALLFERAASIQISFEHVFRLGLDKVQKTQVRNDTIVAAALALDKPNSVTGKRSVQDALQSLGTEKYVRLDYTQHALKKLRDQIYNTVIVLEAPYNENGTILHCTAALKMEEEFGFDLRAGLNLEVALIDFYRDVILNRFLANLLCSTEYSYD